MIGAYLGGQQAPVCTLERRTGQYDRHGRPALAAPIPLTARVQYKRHMVHNAQGELVQCDALAFVAAAVALAPGDVVTIDATPWAVVTHEICRGFGKSHQEIHLGGVAADGTGSRPT